MIDKALAALSHDLNTYLKALFELAANEKAVSLCHVVSNENGALTIPEKSLGFTLINVEEERVTRAQQGHSLTPDGRVLHLNPEIKLNLFVLVAAHFPDYETGLKFLSGAVRFFQGKGVFTPANTPELDPSIVRLIVELNTLNLEQQHHLWGLLGAKYLPSVVYRVRMITIQEARATDDQPPITTIHLDGVQR